jgi:hypothetical protein
MLPRRRVSCFWIDDARSTVVAMRQTIGCAVPTGMLTTCAPFPAATVGGVVLSTRT